MDDQKCPTINTFGMIFHCFLGICRHGVPFEIKAIKKWTCVISKIRFIKCVREHKRVNVVMKRNKNVLKKDRRLVFLPSIFRHHKISNKNAHFVWQLLRKVFAQHRASQMAANNKTKPTKKELRTQCACRSVW